jgi:virginiamycin B lyase
MAAAAFVLAVSCSANAQSVQEFIPDPSAAYEGLAVTSDNIVWYTESSTSLVGGYHDGQTVPFLVVPTPDSAPSSMAVGPDGNPWFLERKAQKLARINHDRSILEIPLPCSIGDAGLYGGSNALWLDERCPTYEALLRVASDGSMSTYIIAPSLARVTSITETPDGDIWYTAAQRNSIGKLDLSGPYISEIKIPAASSSPMFITVGPDGAIWFVEYEAKQIARIDVALGGTTIDEYAWPDTVMPIGIASSNGKLWAIDSMKRIWNFSLSSAAIDRQQVATKESNVIAAGFSKASNGNLWFVENGTRGASALGLIRMDGVFADDLEAALP